MSHQQLGGAAQTCDAGSVPLPLHMPVRPEPFETWTLDHMASFKWLSGTSEQSTPPLRRLLMRGSGAFYNGKPLQCSLPGAILPVKVRVENPGVGVDPSDSRHQA